MSVHEMMEYTFKSKYAGYNDKYKRRETWGEAVDRFCDMFEKKYEDKNGINKYIGRIRKAIKQKTVLGSQRGLQFGGDAVLRKNARLYNCFGVETRFVSTEGVLAFTDCYDGQELVVQTHTGSWQKAVVRNYGKQRLNKITFSKTNNNFSLRATANHRWLLADGTDTVDLKITDSLLKQTSTFEQFDYDSATPEEKLYWCYGFTYGDGTVTNNNYSMVRLCDHDTKYEYRFKELGFSSSSSLSLDGDIICFTGRYKKTAPDPKVDSPELIRAFVRGYLDADGTKNRNINGKLFLRIQSSEKDHIEFIRRCFPIAGVYVISEEDLTGQETNYGIRPYTINFTICDKPDTKTSANVIVQNIESDSIEDVWCLEVENDRSFVLPNGVPTGNCVYSHVDRPRFFQECMYLLLCGCGTGYSVQKHHIAKLPELIEVVDWLGNKTFQIPDSIEGWADAVGVLINSYFPKDKSEFPEYSGRYVEFDYSLISPSGTPLSSCRGKAPGPEPLKNALEKIRSILDYGTIKLKPIEVHDIICHFADAVISGGVRRSALIALFSHDDMDMRKAKIGNWREHNPQRGRANNSVVLLRDQITFEQFEEIIKSTREFGEPGFYWTDDLEFGANPCVEISFKPYFKGLSGWQGCNLSTLNCSKIKTRRDYFRAARDAAVIGTLQAGFTNFPYLGEVSEQIFKHEALLGVSMTGIMEAPDICLDKENQRIAAEIVKRTNRRIAKIIGINPAARTTCVKPEGTASCVLGTSSGVHPHHSKRYIRRIQSNKNETLYQFFKSINPQACEESVWSANDSDDVISFCIEVQPGAKLKNQISAIDFLKIVKDTQQNWVTSGRNIDLCTDPRLNHNVSNTVTVHDHEWDEVTKYIYDNREFFCGISLLSAYGDKDYEQAPFSTVLLPHEQVSLYGDAAIFASGLIEKAKELWGDSLWRACDTLLELNKDNKGGSKQGWISKAKKYADRYLDGNIKQLTYCLKDVDTYKKYIDLKREYKKVDYNEFIEVEDNTEVIQEPACSGGSCLI